MGDNENEILLRSACNNNDIGAVMRLIGIGTKIDCTDSHYNDVTPLMIASECGHVEIVKLLLSNGADVNFKQSKYPHYNTLLNMLEVAKSKTSFEIVKLLIEHGIDVNTCDKNNWNALTIASKRGCDIRIIEYLINKGTNLNMRNNDGDTALDTAIKYNWINIVKVLTRAYLKRMLKSDKADIKKYLDDLVRI